MTKMTMMKVPANLQGQVQRLIDKQKPAKPIKRKEKFTAADKQKLLKLLKAARPLLNRAGDEYDRLEDIEMDNVNLLPADEKWIERYRERLGDVFNYVNNNIDASFY